MRLLKSPWFWLGVVLLLLALWWLFMRKPAPRRMIAPASTGNAPTMGGWADIINSIGATFSAGDSIMGNFRSS